MGVEPLPPAAHRTVVRSPRRPQSYAAGNRNSSSPNLPDTRKRKQQGLELQIALAGALTVIKGYAHPEVAEAFGRARNSAAEHN
jgi:hypothetical protein